MICHPDRGRLRWRSRGICILFRVLCWKFLLPFSGASFEGAPYFQHLDTFEAFLSIAGCRIALRPSQMSWRNACAASPHQMLVFIRARSSANHSERRASAAIFSLCSVIPSERRLAAPAAKPATRNLSFFCVSTLFTVRVSWRSPHLCCFIRVHL